MRCCACLSALLPPGSTQHVTPSATAAPATASASAAVKPVTVRRGVVSGNDIPMITELGLSVCRSVGLSSVESSVF